MANAELLAADELQNAFARAACRRAPFEMSYTLKGQWHKTIAVCATCREGLIYLEATDETPRLPELPMHFPVNVCFQEDYWRFLFETTVSRRQNDTQTSPDAQQLSMDVTLRLERIAPPVRATERQTRLDDPADRIQVDFGLG